MSSTFVLLGHPVGHSMSPVIHQAAYGALGLPHRYELVDVPDRAALEVAMARVRSGELGGANVTVPWKREALALADSVDASARSVGAANVLLRTSDGRLEAHNTDVPALAEEVRARVAEPDSVLILGNGGAALGAAAAARKLGAIRIWVSARRFDEHESPEAWPHAAEFLALGATPVAWPSVSPAPMDGAFGVACRSATVLLQATSAGMQGKGGGPELAALIPWRELGRCRLAYDLVYNPPDTEFLRAASVAGLPNAHGLGMLVAQAALAIELWLHRTPPREVLRAAADAALLARRSA